MTVLNMRTAKILGGADSLSQVQAYMPGNYTARLDDDTIVIEGHDSAGWTLDGYVIPRLASGLIFAEETTAAEWPRTLWVCDECFTSSEDQSLFVSTRLCVHCAGTCDCPETEYGIDHQYQERNQP
jgi:hypothetical protein